MGVARPEGIEPPAYRFEACRSIHLSYGRTRGRTYAVYTDFWTVRLSTNVPLQLSHVRTATDVVIASQDLAQRGVRCSRLGFAPVFASRSEMS